MFNNFKVLLRQRRQEDNMNIFFNCKPYKELYNNLIKKPNRKTKQHFRPKSTTTIAVSYTHLDVYKRQL